MTPERIKELREEIERYDTSDRIDLMKECALEAFDEIVRLKSICRDVRHIFNLKGVMLAPRNSGH